MDDLDAALDGLESAAPALPEPQNPDADKASPDGGPPPIRKRGKGGRTEFEGLFVSDSSPMPKVGGIDEKIAYFREKLRRAEVQVGRVKEAWTIREEEMDALDAAAQADKKRADENQKGCEDLQKFLEQKKGEFEEYGAKVAAAFSEHENLDKERIARIAELELALEKVRGEVDALRGKATANGDTAKELRDELKQARAEKKELSEKIKELTAAEQAAQRQLQQAFGDAASDEEERSQSEEKLRAALKKSQADAKKLKEALDDLKKQGDATKGGDKAELKAAKEKVDALHKDLDTRTDLIKRLKGIAETAKEKIAERNEKIKKLEEVNRVLAAQSVDSLDEPKESGPGKDELERALKTLALAEKSLADIEEDHAALVEQYEEAAETRIGDGAKKLRRILMVTTKLLSGEE